MSAINDLPVYRWGAWPEHLLTKLQMDEAGYQTGKKLPPPAAKVSREKSPGGWMLLYDKNAGVPKRAISEEQKAAAKARGKALAKRYYCPHCGSPVRLIDSWCRQCADKASAIDEARELLALPEFYVLDTETTGLGSSAEIIEIAIVNQAGEVALNTRVKPRCMEGWEDAIAIHGITPAMLEHAPTWSEVWPQVEPYLDKTVIIFNAEFDMGMIRNTCRANEMPHLEWRRFGDWRCLMTLDAQHYGEWSDYHQSYKWQKLESGDHSALGDAQAALRLLKSIAADKTFEEQPNP